MLASNRGPIQFEKDDRGELQMRRGAGGLITALQSVLPATKALWIASAMTDEDKKVAAETGLFGLPEDDPLYWIHLVDIPKDIYDLYYNVFSNRIFWFLQHYLFDIKNEPAFGPDFRTAWQEGYVEVNRRFAESIERLVRDEDSPIILIQDYHLYLVGGFLSQMKPDAFLFHFVHVPWCSPDYFRILPGDIRHSVLESLLANDIIGFHSRRYVRNFILCCQDFLGCRVDLRANRVFYGDRNVLVKAYPISISGEEAAQVPESTDLLEERDRLTKLREDYQVIVRIDRTELSKNLIRGFDAFSLLLDKHEDLKGKVKLLVYTYPSRQELEPYRIYRREIEKKTLEINERFGNRSWQPVALSIQDNYDRSVAAMSNFDVLLTNPLFDGMNLVAKEAAALNRNDGVIVLSENAGAYEELRDGVLGINPFDIEDTAAKLHQALTMTPLERGLRAARLKEIVKRNDATKWIHHQIKDIAKASSSLKTPYQRIK